MPVEPVCRWEQDAGQIEHVGANFRRWGILCPLFAVLCLSKPVSHKRSRGNPGNGKKHTEVVSLRREALQEDANGVRVKPRKTDA